MNELPVHEQIHLENLRRIERKILRYFNGSVNRITATFKGIKYNGKVFKLKDYPELLKAVQREMRLLQNQVYGVVVNGIEESWKLSNQKNNLFVDVRLGERKTFLSTRAFRMYYDPNEKAMLSFIGRQAEGMKLSDRVWQVFNGFQTELEAALGVGISRGQSAISLAKDIKQYLKEPDKLFRRVRDAKGRLVLSKAAKEYHPGQGVYRSSYLNAKRLAATETNMAYRTADWLRWQNLPFVIGIEVKLAAEHEIFDICDHMAGVYPKDFFFRGWHPFCICYQVAVQMSDKDYNEREIAILEGRPFKVKMISKPPPSFFKFVTKNAKRIRNWKHTPYWAKDNPKFVNLDQ
jgi:hypothetical protein